MPIHQPKRRSKRRRGISLVEVLFALLISTLVLLSAICLFIMTLTAGETAVSIGATSEDAANAVQNIAAAIRQASSFQMLDNTTYDAVNTQGAVVAVTGLQIAYPAAGSAVSITTTASGTIVTLTGATSIYNIDASTTGATLTFYRSDINGNPAPSTGTCLWVTGTQNGGPVNRALIKTIAAETDAVQFIQPYKSDGVTPIPNAVKISIVTSSNNGVAGTVSSHSSKGATTMLTAYQVYLRNHNPLGVTSTGVHGRTQLAN